MASVVGLGEVKSSQREQRDEKEAGGAQASHVQGLDGSADVSLLGLVHGLINKRTRHLNRKGLERALRPCSTGEGSKRGAGPSPPAILVELKGELILGSPAPQRVLQDQPPVLVLYKYL